jgi:hypothetical protein
MKAVFHDESASERRRSRRSSAPAITFISCTVNGLSTKDYWKPFSYPIGNIVFYGGYHGVHYRYELYNISPIGSRSMFEESELIATLEEAQAECNSRNERMAVGHAEMNHGRDGI